jgi:poly(A) polymerase
MSPALAQLLALPDVAALLSAFAGAGIEARLVGGAVRDAVMGRRPGDIDVATSMPPRDVMALALAHGWKAVPTGIDHGTVTIVIAGRPYEVTTLRKDVETDGRRAVVAFTEDFGIDAFRRDFTLNALSLSADGTLHDYATGVADAKAGIIRFMGDPETRIREDYLRILRFFRFQASHGAGAPDTAALAACARLKTGLAGISRERVRQELLKLIVAPGPAGRQD